jgi:hypothetical protein
LDEDVPFWWIFEGVDSDIASCIADRDVILRAILLKTFGRTSGMAGKVVIAWG